ncbi:MAG TPA: biotin--[acetyl-CoA-carboxylase] ligase [Polyangiales bacterium]
MHPLSAESVVPRLRTQRYGRSLHFLPVTGSTNDDAKAAALAHAPDGHVVIADMQQAGRGSHGRTWTSPQGEDLYFSIVARPSVAFPELPPLTLAVGLGVAEAVDDLLGAPTRLPRSQVKWPNDVWVAGKKCAGILVEANALGSTLDFVVIGIGLNVNRLSFPDELGHSATSLRANQPELAVLDRADTLCHVLLSVERWVDRFTSAGASSVSAALQPRLLLRGQRARCGDVLGIVRGVSPQGALRMETATGLQELIAGRLTAADDA